MENRIFAIDGDNTVNCELELIEFDCESKLQEVIEKNWQLLVPKDSTDKLLSKL